MVDSEEVKKLRKPDGPACDRALLCPEEWAEPDGRKVIGEFHKKGLPKGLPGVEADLERFEEFWSDRGSVNMQGAYHKKGAPYAEEFDRDVEGSGDRQPQDDIMDVNAGNTPEVNVGMEKPESSEKKDEAFYGPFRHVLTEKEKPQSDDDMPEPQSNRPINLATIEIISYALFRVIFGKGVSIPLKKKGIVNADITIRNNDIIINTNEFYVGMPDLSVWKIIYTHQGKTILEFGRGVPKGFKVNRWNALKLALSIWMQNRAATKAKEKLKKERAKANVDKLKRAGVEKAE